MNELVSIITPSYNTADFISQTIECVLNQTYTNWEMIIVDDCSTDNTKEVISKYNDTRIIYVENETNSGAAFSRNKALKIAKGEWIAFLDSDDLWDKTKIESQLKFMKTHNYFFSYTNYREINEDNIITNQCISGPNYINKRKMYQYCWPGCLTVMYNAKKIGIIQIENLKKNNDYAIWLKAVKKANCYLLNETLASYRKRTGSISNQSFYKLIKYHYYLFKLGEHKNVFASLLYTLQNLFYGFIKKIKYK